MRRGKQKVKTQMVLTIIIAFLMVASILGFSMLQGEGEGKRKYGKFTLVQRNMVWVTKVNDVEVQFEYLPEELRNLNISPSAVQMIKNSYQAGTTSDMNDTNPQEIALFQESLMQFLMSQKIYLVNGFTTTNEYNLPMLDCANATMSVPIIKLVTSNETSASVQDGSCIIIKAASGNEFLMLKDKLVYEILGIKVA